MYIFVEGEGEAHYDEPTVPGENVAGDSGYQMLRSVNFVKL